MVAPTRHHRIVGTAEEIESLRFPQVCLVCGEKAATFFEYKAEITHRTTQGMGGMGGVKSVTRSWTHPITLRLPYCGIRHGPRKDPGKILTFAQRISVDFVVIFLSTLAGMMLGMLVVSGIWPDSVWAMLILGAPVGLVVGWAFMWGVWRTALRILFGEDRTEWPFLVDRGFFLTSRSISPTTEQGANQFMLSSFPIEIEIGFSNPDYDAAFVNANENYAVSQGDGGVRVVGVG